MTDDAKCPVVHATAAKAGASNRDWWPNQLNLKVLQQNSEAANPMDPDFDYAAADFVNAWSKVMDADRFDLA